jgi:Spy/CpxP family protein refolding chaperone
MRPKKFSLAAIVLMASMFSAAAASAQMPPGIGGPGGAMPLPLMMLIRQANLTSDQQAKVHDIMRANFSQAQPLLEQLRSVHDQIADKLMSTGTVGASDLTPLQTQEAQIHQQLDSQMMSTALQIRGLLSADQLARIASLHSQLKSLRSQIDALLGPEMPPMGPPPGL